MNPRTRRLRKLRRRQARRDALLARVAATLRKAVARNAQIPEYYAWLEDQANYREWARARMLASLRGDR